MIGNEQKSKIRENGKPEKTVFPREPIREWQRKPAALPPQTSRICLNAVPTLLKKLTLDIFSGSK